MRKFFNTLEETTTINLQLSVEEDLRQYQFSIIEVTTENESKHKSEISKTIFSTIKKVSNNLFTAHIEIYDREYKNKEVSLTEKEFLARLGEINDNVLLTINSVGDVKKIDNLSALQERAKSKITKLVKSHVGEAVESTFKYYTEFYENEKRVVLDLKNYNQLGLLLNNFYGVYAPKIIKKNTVRYVNFMDDTIVNVEEVAAIHKIDEDNGTVEIKVNGTMIDPIYKSMFFKTAKDKSIVINEEVDFACLNKYEGYFMFDTETGIVKNATLKILFTYGQHYNKTITYQLNEIVHADNN